jgi:uncharacterized membrane protein
MFGDAIRVEGDEAKRMRYQTSVVIDARPEVVWSVLADVERWPEWTATMRSVRWLGADRLERGARAQVAQPKLPNAVWEVTEVDPGKSFTWVSRRTGVAVAATHLVGADDAGWTGVELIIEMTGALAWLAASLTGRLSRSYLAIEAAGLKRRAESGDTPAAPQ